MTQHSKPLKLPIGIQDFADIREEGYLYVDKTATIFDLLTTGKYYFLSRPRRFGKSLTLSVIKYLYGGRRDLFTGLWIEPQWDWNKTHPVLHFSFIQIDYQGSGLDEAIKQMLRQAAQEHGIALESDSIKNLFAELIGKLSQAKGKIVLLIDEYDKPLIDYLDNPDKAKAHQQLLKAFYSILKDSGTHIEFLLITGVSKFSQVSIFSDLNHLKDITLHPRFVTLTGYTQQEVGQHFGERIAELATTGNRSIEAQTALIRDWYNGYSWGQGVTLYNPFSLMSYLDAGQFTNYWFSTGTPTFLLKLMRKKWIYDISAVELSELAFSSYDVEDLQVYPILFQTGYLTIKGRNEFGLYCMGYPNREVQESMLMYLISNVSQDESSMSKTMVLQIRAAFYQNDMESLIRLINSIFKNIPSHIFIAEAEAYYHSLIFLVFFYLGQYAESEVNTNNGRLDCVVKTDKHIYVIEFKLNQSAKVALQQIKDKGYAEKYLADSRRKVLLGVNFSSEDKAVKDWLVDDVT
jgi:hypothetical protein